MLTECELAKLADDVAELHPDEIIMLRASNASDGMGGRTNTYASVGTFAARVSPASNGDVEQEIGGKLRDGTVWRVAIPAGTDIRIGDRISYSGLTLSVEGIRAPRSVEIERVIYVQRAAS